MSQETCRNLHKVTNVDDLLKQLYDNIDSYCLFDMPTEELEKIWGLKIFDLTGEYNDSINKERWRYDKEGNGLYLIKMEDKRIYFQLYPTQSFISKNVEIWGDSDLSRGKLSTIPTYDVESAIVPMDHRPRFTEEQYAELPNSDFDFMHNYYWLNSERSIDKPYLELSTGNVKKVPGIRFYKDTTNWQPGQKIFLNFLERTK